MPGASARVSYCLPSLGSTDRPLCHEHAGTLCSSYRARHWRLYAPALFLWAADVPRIDARHGVAGVKERGRHATCPPSFGLEITRLMTHSLCDRSRQVEVPFSSTGQRQCVLTPTLGDDRTRKPVTRDNRSYRYRIWSIEYHGPHHQASEANVDVEYSSP